MRCPLGGCGKKSASPGILCAEHASDNHLAHCDWDREQRVELKTYFNRPKLLSDTNDDWRGTVVARAVLPSRSRLGCPDGSTWKRFRRKEGSRRTYSPTPDMGYDGLWPSEYQLAHVELMDAIRRCLRYLTPTQEIVVRMYYGIAGFLREDESQMAIDGDTLSLEKIGHKVFLTRERVRQIVRDSLWRLLRKRETRQILRPFYGEQGRFFKPPTHREIGFILDPEEQARFREST